MPAKTLSLLALLILTACLPVPAAPPGSPPAPQGEAVPVQEPAGPVQIIPAPGSTASTNCPADQFPRLQPDPANTTYPAPALLAYCTDTHLIIETNNIPNFPFDPVTPNDLAALSLTLSIPLAPQMAGETTAIPLGGPTAVTLTGLLIFGPTEAPETGYRDPYLDGLLDACNGHTAPGGVYHFHASPRCLLKDAGGALGQIIGYAFDGYPILAPYLCADTAPGTFPGEVVCHTVVEVRSSWQAADPNAANAWEMHRYIAGSGDLDACNGMQFANGSYAYFATAGFPYFMGCYRGVVETANLFGQGAGLGGEGAPPPGGPAPP